MKENQSNAQKEQKAIVLSEDSTALACYLDSAKYNQAYRAANTLAASTLVPKQYQNKPHDCFIALQLSRSMGVEPFMLMQNTYVVHGKPGFEAKFIIAMVNSKGPFKGPIQWKFEGEGAKRSCTAYAYLKESGEKCEATVSWGMVEKEGWSKKEGSKWMTMPDLMFQYRSATFLARLYCPEVLFGMQTVEELYDVGERKQVESVEVRQGVDALADKLKKKEKADQEKEAELTKEAIREADESLDKIMIRDAAEAETEAELTKEAIESLEKKILPEERYYCEICDETFAEPRGANKNLCPKLHKNIIDRLPDSD
ncbi:MAG: recombinase RecT [Dehalococcoidia bacterium]|nr:recombinase RecT [Candidatus Neomarinimicrobiota bacterium]MCK9520405.1 recombinase RecT [Dehalococcoidia bacterium]